MHHGTLVNLRTERVQFKLVSTTLTPEARRDFTVDEGDWRPVIDARRNLCISYALKLESGDALGESPNVRLRIEGPGQHHSLKSPM